MSTLKLFVAEIIHKIARRIDLFVLGIFHKIASSLDLLADRLERPHLPPTYESPEHGWTCFHCGKTFLSQAGARRHFGMKPTETPMCLQYSKSMKDIAAERVRQINEEGWTAAHDDEHTDGSLAEAAACYAHPLLQASKPPHLPIGWPLSWDPEWWKPSDDRRRDLIKAGALIVAEVDRIDRKGKSS